MITLRKFSINDIENKVKWINDGRNNEFLHYNLPLNVKDTINWFKKNKDRTDRYDAIIEFEGVAVGVIGLLSIKEKDAEYYITLGEHDYKGKGVAKEASLQLLDYARDVLNLDNIYLYTETKNIVAQKLFEKIGFKNKRLIKNSAKNRGKLVDRYYYDYDLRG